MARTGVTSESEAGDRFVDFLVMDKPSGPNTQPPGNGPMNGAGMVHVIPASVYGTATARSTAALLMALAADSDRTSSLLNREEMARKAGVAVLRTEGMCLRLCI